LRRDLPELNSFNQELVTALALLIGVLALTVRILLLLAGLLTGALLLAGLLGRFLILLTRSLVLIGHRYLPCSMSQEIIRKSGVGCIETWFPRQRYGCGPAAFEVLRNRIG
jgi:uncharacterized membrane protein YkgB